MEAFHEAGPASPPPPPAAPPSPAPAAEATYLHLPTAATHDAVYCCQRCRRPLFAPEHVTSHEVGQHGFAFRRAAKERGAASSVGGSGCGDGGGVSEAAEAGAGCTSFFLSEALQWMEAASSDVEGKLTCPKCAVRVGSVKWAGGQCSCEWRGRALEGG